MINLGLVPIEDLVDEIFKRGDGVIIVKLNSHQGDRNIHCYKQGNYLELLGLCSHGQEQIIAANEMLDAEED